MKGKGFISEGDVALLLRRYTASTLLALLQEIYNTAESKLDWTTLMKASNCGISNARECQTLWRHLAYRANLPDGFEDDMEPLEDDSDLEFEVEPLPGVSPEVAANVAACVKVLAATGSTANTSIKNQEACFIIDIPNSSSGWEVRGNGQISNVVIQGGHTPETQPARKKRKLWTSEEDQELIAAVEKCGEGNWATMLKGAFKHERTAAQLSQRWALIRKRRDSQSGISQNNTIDNQTTVPGTTPAAGSQLPVETGNSLLVTTDCQRACVSVGPTSVVGNTGTVLTGVPKTVSLPVSQEQNCSSGNTPCMASLPQVNGKGRPPVKRTGIFGSQLGRSTNSITSVVGASSGQGANGGGDLRLAKSVNAASVSLASSSSVPGRFSVSSSVRNSALSSVGRAVSKSSAGPDPMVQAAAVAAGARIAPASAAASLLKAAHSGNVVHIGPGGVSMGKAGAQSQSSNAATSSVKIGSGVGSRSSAGTLVHYIRTGTGSPQSLHPTGQRASQVKGQLVRSGVAQSIRSGAIPLPSPGLPGVSSLLQKSHAPPFMSGLKAKATLPSEVRGTTAIDATTAKPLERIDGISPSLPEGIIKKITQDIAANISSGPQNIPTESASGCSPIIEQNIAGFSSETAGPATNTDHSKPESQGLSEKASFSDSSDVVDLTNVMVPSISSEVKGDRLKSRINDSPQDDDPD